MNLLFSALLSQNNFIYLITANVSYAQIYVYIFMYTYLFIYLLILFFINSMIAIEMHSAYHRCRCRLETTYHQYSSYLLLGTN